MNKINIIFTFKELVLDNSLGRISLGYLLMESFESLSNKLLASLFDDDDDENFLLILS